MTPLDKTLKRALVIDGRDYVVTLTPAALKVSLKGRRLGVELKWGELIRGESALAVALQASVGKFENDMSTPNSLPKRAKSKPLRPRTKRQL